MAYYVAVETEKNVYEGVSIKRCRHSFTTNYTYDEPHACTLKEINNITTTYQDEEEFKIALTKIYAMSAEHLDKPLAIIYAEGIEKRLVKGKILYEDSRNLIENIDEVIRYIETKYKENDSKFFRQLSETLRADSINKSIVSQIASTIEVRVVNGMTEPTQKLDNNITTSAKLLVYENNVDENGVVSPTRKVDYEALHFVVSFIADYEATLAKDKKSGYAKTKQKPEQ